MTHAPARALVALLGLAAACGASDSPRLDLHGLTGLTVTTSGGMPGPTRDACSSDNKNVFTLDLQTHVFTWEHCAIDASTSAAVRTTESHAVTDLEVTAALLMLARVSTEHGTGCGLDKSVDTLDLRFGDRVELYQDDFYACQAPQAGRTFVQGIDGIVTWLWGVANYPQLPGDFSEFWIITLDPATYASEPALADANAACGYDIDLKYTVTAATRQLAWSSCVSPDGVIGHQLVTGSRLLSESEFAQVLQAWARFELGATGACSTPRPTRLLSVTTSSGTFESFENDYGACGSSSHANVFVVGLDELAAQLELLAR